MHSRITANKLEHIIHPPQNTLVHARDELSKDHSREIECIYTISELIDSKGDSLEEILQGIVDLIPPAWQHPDICCARLVVDDNEYTTSHFRESAWKQEEVVNVNGICVGKLDVYYLQLPSESDIGTFLESEQRLLSCIAERTGKTIERIRIARQRETDRNELSDAETALRKVLAQIEDDKREWSNSITANIDKLIMPIIRSLESRIPDHLSHQLSSLKQQLDKLTSPHANRLSKCYSTMTLTEIEICNMIRDGFSTKEIARARHVSPATIAKQRERIRKKLRVCGTSANLGAHLRMLSNDAY